MKYTCSHCSIEFEARPKKKNTGKRFCSLACANISRRSPLYGVKHMILTDDRPVKHMCVYCKKISYGKKPGYICRKCKQSLRKAVVFNRYGNRVVAYS